MTEQPVIAATGVCVERAGKEILRGVDITLHAGEVVGVLGPSGAGKSTLFGAIVGNLIPDRGSVSLDGRDVTRWPLWRRARSGIGYVPQGPSVLWDLTVRLNLEAYRRIAGMPLDDVEHAADSVGLAARLDVVAGALSGGERRRLELARALTRRPKVLVCDEPFAGVDPAGAEKLGNLLRALSHGGAAILLADHHVSEALRICQRAVLLIDGRVAAEAGATEFEAIPLVRERYLGGWQGTRGA
jgi:lipopolysaccharide export system ATP-binding protein